MEEAKTLQGTEEQFMKYLVRDLNETIKELPGEYQGQVSDGYHTFDELYDHRIQLYIALCSMLSRWQRQFSREAKFACWRSRLHHDGTGYMGWFIMGTTIQGLQISYHLPEKVWDQCFFAQELDRAPAFDGHTSADVLERLKVL